MREEPRPRERDDPRSGARARDRGLRRGRRRRERGAGRPAQTPHVISGDENTHVAAGVVTLAYSAVLNQLLPDAAHVPANLAAAATAGDAGAPRRRIVRRSRSCADSLSVGRASRAHRGGAHRRGHRHRGRMPADRPLLRRRTRAVRQPPPGGLRNCDSHPHRDRAGRGTPLPRRPAGAVPSQILHRGCGCGQLAAVRSSGTCCRPCNPSPRITGSRTPTDHCALGARRGHGGRDDGRRESALQCCGFAAGASSPPSSCTPRINSSAFLAARNLRSTTG